MKTMMMSALRSKLAKTLVRVQEDGEVVRVVLRGKPLVDISPAKRRNGTRRLGGLRGTVAIQGDMVLPWR